MAEKAFISVAEAAEESGLSTDILYELLRKENPLPHIKVGRYYRVDRERFIDYLRDELGSPHR